MLIEADDRVILVMHIHWTSPSTQGAKRRCVSEDLCLLGQSCASREIVIYIIYCVTRSVDLQGRMSVHRAFFIGALLLISLYFGATVRRSKLRFPFMAIQGYVVVWLFLQSRWSSIVSAGIEQLT